ncbi:MAG: hypothetical protein ACO1Q7_12335 [Gemmatimonas sp.]
MLLQITEQLVALTQPFADIYADSKPLMVAVTALHLGGLLAGGGLAIGTDRTILRTSPANPIDARRTIEETGATHRYVVPALAAIVLSGLAFLAADIRTFIASPVYWIKMACVAALLLNGLRMVRTERALQSAFDPAPAATTADAANAVSPLLWKRLRASARTSLVLWFVILLLGVLVANS